jgi:hypothetical protein
MKKPTVTSVVRNAPSHALSQAFADIKSAESYDLELSRSLRAPAMGRPNCVLGENFHSALANALRGEWIDRRYWPYVRVLRDWLADEGVTRIYSEWEFRNSKQIRGCCDLLVAGGPNKRGVLEVKLVGQLPEECPYDDQCQLGLYTRAAADRFHDYGSYWGALAYVCPQARVIRIFEWQSMNACCKAAGQVLAAA